MEVLVWEQEGLRRGGTMGWEFLEIILAYWFSSIIWLSSL